MAASKTTLDQQKTEFWITGFFSQDKILWYRVEVGEEDFAGAKNHHGWKFFKWLFSGCRRRLEGELLNVEEPVPSVVDIKTPSIKYVTLDHFIYTAGGYNGTKGRYIYCLDTTNLVNGWKKLDAVMKVGRRHPQVAVLEGKIYFFGGTSDGLKAPSEVYDPDRGIIEELPVDEYTHDLRLVGVDDVKKRIIFFPGILSKRRKNISEFLCFYDPKAQTWAKEEISQVVAFSLDGLIGCNSHMVVHTTIYWIPTYSPVINAYDFVEKKLSYSAVLKFLTKEENPGWPEDTYVFPFLLHMNGDCFCLFWNANESFSSEGPPYIHCSGLKISESDTYKNFLTVSVLGTQTYAIRGFNVMDVLPIYRKHDTVPPPRTITTNNETQVPEDVSTTMTTMGLIELQKTRNISNLNSGYPDISPPAIHTYNQVMATSTTTLDQQKTKFWITGYFSQDKVLWYRVEVGEEDFAGVKKQHGSHSGNRIGLEEGLLNLEEPVPLMVDIEMSHIKSVTLDHFIYTAGGYNGTKGRYIYCLDTTNLVKGWKKLDAVMKMGRLRPQVAALEGKIYFFGGSSSDDSKPPSEVYDPVMESIADLPVDNTCDLVLMGVDDDSKPLLEVYDPVTGTIEELPVDNTCDLWLLGVDDVRKRIIFCSFKAYSMMNNRRQFLCLLSYDPKSQTWAEEETSIQASYRLDELLNSRAHVVVHTTVYWMLNYSPIIHAYDFVRKRFFISAVLKFLTRKENPGWTADTCFYSFLLHMNGDCFCLFWNAKEIGSEIHCTGLKISESNTHSNVLTISVLGTQTYTIRGCGFNVMDVQPMYRKHDTLPPPDTITTNNATQVLEDVRTTMTTMKEKRLKIEWPLVAGAIGIFAVYLRYRTSS